MYVSCFFYFTVVQFASAFPIYDISGLSYPFICWTVLETVNVKRPLLRIVLCSNRSVVYHVECLSMLLSYHRETLSAWRAERLIFLVNVQMNSAINIGQNCRR
jgi:hypothetical protein